MLDFLAGDLEQDYYKLVSRIESNDNPRAKNPLSSASGRFQFIKSTWEGLGYDWKDIFNDALQWEAIEKFTAANAAILKRSGCYLNFATLYGAHFLGAGGFLRIMRASPKDALSKVTTAAQRNANPSILGGDKTVKDFTDWLERKTGHKYDKDYSSVLSPSKPEKSGATILAIVGAIVVYVALKIFGVI